MDGDLLRYNRNKTYALIDLETFNLCLHFCHNRPWQVGVLKVKGDTIIDSKDIRIDWKKDAPHLGISKEAADVTHFNQEYHDRYAIDPRKAFEIFWPILEECDYIIMHNGLRFDLYLLKGYAEMMNVPWKHLVKKIIDTKSVAQGIKMGIPFIPKQDSFLEYQYRMANAVVKGIKTSLVTLGKEFGIDHNYENLHDAICDLELNLKVWNKLKSQIEI